MNTVLKHYMIISIPIYNILFLFTPSPNALSLSHATQANSEKPVSLTFESPIILTPERPVSPTSERPIILTSERPVSLTPESPVSITPSPLQTCLLHPDALLLVEFDILLLGIIPNDIMEIRGIPVDSSISG